MNFKVNLFFHLYETQITPLGIPIPTVRGLVMGWVRGGHNGKKQVCFKMIFRQNKVF